MNKDFLDWSCRILLVVPKSSYIFLVGLVICIRISTYIYIYKITRRRRRKKEKERKKRRRVFRESASERYIDMYMKMKKSEE